MRRSANAIRPRSSTRGRRRTRCSRWLWPAGRAARYGITTAISTSTSPASWSIPTSATSTRRLSPRSSTRPQRLTTVAPAQANPTRAEAAELITARAPEGFNKVFFTNGGADANENAIRMARLVTGRDKVISRYRSYHGNTGAAIVATGDWRRIPNEYARGHVHVFGPYLYRSEFWAETPEQESERALQHLERVIQAEGPATVAAICWRPFPGPQASWCRRPATWPGCAGYRDRYDIVLISRRGDGRIRPDRRVAGPGRLRRSPGPDHLRQGRELRLRPGWGRHHLRRRSPRPSTTGSSPAD